MPHTHSDLDYSNRPPPPPPKLPPGDQEAIQQGQPIAPQHSLYSTRPQNHHFEPDNHTSNGFSALLVQRPEGVYSNSPASQPPPLPPNIYAAGDRSNLSQQLHQEPISPEGFEDSDHWSSQTHQGRSRPPYVSPPSSTRATLVHQYPYRNTASPEPSLSIEATSRVPGEEASARHEPSYGAISVETSVSDSHPQIIDQIAANTITISAFKEASTSLLHESIELHDEGNGTDTAPTVGGRNQVRRLHENPSCNAAVEYLPQAANNHVSSLVLNNASALGVGGPSDWEYFGDYATEDIDDTELYSTLRPQASNIPALDTAELPSEPFPSVEVYQQHARDSTTADTGEPHAMIPSPGGGTSLKQSTQPMEDAQSIEHQLRHSKPPLHSEVTLSATTEDTTEGEGSLLDQSHSSESKEAVQTFIIPPVPHMENSGLGFLVSGPAQNLKMDDKKLEDFPTENSDRRLPAPSGEGQTSSKSSSSQRHSDEDSVHSRTNSPIRKTYTPPPLHPGQWDSSAPTAAKPEMQMALISKDGADPYAKLDAWAKASLNRYVAMLRQEAQATTNQEKHRIFVTFTNRESRLRTVLYEAETDERVHDLNISSITPVNDVAEPSPASPHTAEQSTQPTLDEQVTSPIDADSYVESVALASDQKLANLVTTPEPPSTEDSYTMMEPPDDIQYSPGGRPIVNRPVAPGIDHYLQLAPAPRRKTPKIVPPVQVTPSNTNEAHSPGSDTPMVVEPEIADPKTQLEAPKSITMRPSGYPGIQKYISPPPNAPDRHIYPPLGQNDQVSESPDPSTDRQPTITPYSAQRTGSLDSGLEDTRPLETGRGGTINRPLVTKTEDGETLHATAISNAVPAILGVGPRKTSPDLVPQVKTLNLDQSAFASLKTVLPEHSIPTPDPPILCSLRQAADAVVDDFSFIRKTVMAWDTKVKKLREHHDKARHSRQIESEERINGLFDEQQIGYGDISILEAEFKRSEASKKADEDRAEYETFSTDVFEVVWTRLHSDIAQLTPQYAACTQILNDALAGKDMFEGFGNRPALAPAMEMTLALHQRVETRYQKAFEAVLERNRRLKKIQVAPLYALGSITEVKKLEKQFEDAEREAILDHCRKRAKRADGLMNVLHQNTQRGVGANQDYMEAIMQAVRRIADDAASNPSRYLDDPRALHEIAVKAESVVKALARASEQVVQMFHVADKLLSAADYEVSVAEARLARADAATIKQRSEEKVNEDLKLVHDLEHRLALIRQGFKRTNDEIAKVFSIVEGKHTDVVTAADSLRPSLGSSDPAHEERMLMALEEAKRRNAFKESALNNNAY